MEEKNNSNSCPSSGDVTESPIFAPSEKHLGGTLISDGIWMISDFEQRDRKTWDNVPLQPGDKKPIFLLLTGYSKGKIPSRRVSFSDYSIVVYSDDVLTRGEIFEEISKAQAKGIERLNAEVVELRVQLANRTATLAKRTSQLERLLESSLVG